MVKKKIELNPIAKKVEIEPQKDISIEDNKFFIKDSGEEGQDSYFKNVVNQLMNYENPSTKTEYLNVNENFAGTKLQFLAKYGNIPILKEFVHIFETKRISLERKGRKELIMALVEREKEMQREQEQKWKNMLMGGV